MLNEFQCICVSYKYVDKQGTNVLFLFGEYSFVLKEKYTCIWIYIKRNINWILNLEDSKVLLHVCIANMFLVSGTG